MDASSNIFRGPVALQALLAVLLAAACDSPTAPAAAGQPLPDVRAWVGGEALNALDAAGHFVLPDRRAPGSAPMVTPTRAVELAMGFIRTWVTNPDVIGGLAPFIEEGHGGPIDWPNVRPGPRPPYFAHTPYPVLADSQPVYIRRAYGPHYHVLLFSGERQVVSVAVAAYNTDLRIDERGFVDEPPQSGEEFFGQGVPRQFDYYMPLAPEQAVAAVATRTGAKVMEVPVLVQRRPGEGWEEARWRLVLDREVTVHDLETGASLATDTLYVSIDDVGPPSYDWSPVPHWFVPEPVQPRQDTLTFVLPDSALEWRTIVVDLRPELPIEFREVAPLPTATAVHVSTAHEPSLPDPRPSPTTAAPPRPPV